MAHGTGPEMSCQGHCSSAHAAWDEPQGPSGRPLSSHTGSGSLVHVSAFRNIKPVDMKYQNLTRFSSRVTTEGAPGPGRCGAEC